MANREHVEIARQDIPIVDTRTAEARTFPSPFHAIIPPMITSQDLEKLPLRAIVAFAARCARRVQPLFRSGEKNELRAVEAAIACAERCARGEEGAPTFAFSLADADPFSFASASAARAAAFAARAAHGTPILPPTPLRLLRPPI
jgi:hypothetical protein